MYENNNENTAISCKNELSNYVNVSKWFFSLFVPPVNTATAEFTLQPHVYSHMQSFVKIFINNKNFAYSTISFHRNNNPITMTKRFLLPNSNRMKKTDNKQK